ncbi:MAG: glycoside hydrolase family 57 protein [Candidatus Eisenbacteria bacterium]|nr:glycoside hydrolase family 57 protein [Candidatus Eisenbacteria bacterium]
MSAKTVHLAIVWHMHQPMYKDPRTGVYVLPWVRLHASKDYADMVRVLRKFPDVRVTFNLVPSLMEQIEEYARNEAKDYFLEISRKAPESMFNAEKLFLLKNFFPGHMKKVADRYPYYYRLYRKTVSLQEALARKEGLAKFTAQDFLDLQALFNLVWLDPSYLQDPDLAGIASKASGFKPEERDAILAKQLAVTANVLPAYREALSRGQIELSCSAYYHPILPLLCDVSVAREAMPDAALPKSQIKWPEDALAQLTQATSYYERLFGSAPRGLWPSEGGVSEKTLGLARKAGFEWAAADEDILARAKDVARGGKREVRSFLYAPYRFDTPSGPISVVFRDKVLSDLIGFTYMNWTTKAAVGDFMLRLARVAERWQEPDPLVTVILDGENCWEFYENDGQDFLELLYERLSSEPGIKTTTISEYLERFPASRKLEAVPAGSWIDSNFRIWVGHVEDNIAWDLLADARNALNDYAQCHASLEESEPVKAAWREIYIAEGSDWFWWYGDDNTSAFDLQFDALFRSHLIKVYELLGLEVPSQLYSPVIGAAGTKPHAMAAPPAGFLKPSIDGKITDYYEWQLGGYCDLSKSGGSMRQALSVVRALYYGFDLNNLYVRVDTTTKPDSQEFSEITLVFEVAAPVRVRIKVRLGPDGRAEPRVSVEKRVDSTWEAIPASVRWALADIVEFAIPFADAGLSPGRRVDAVLLVFREGMVIESWPAQEKLAFLVPSDDFESSIWTA